MATVMNTTTISDLEAHVQAEGRAELVTQVQKQHDQITVTRNGATKHITVTLGIQPKSAS